MEHQLTALDIAGCAENLPLHIVELRRTLAQRPLRPYDRISYWPTVMDRETVERAIAGEPFNILGIEFSFANDVSGDPNETRSKQLYLQSWNHLDPILAFFNDSNDQGVLAFICDRICEWIDQFDIRSLTPNEHDLIGEATGFLGSATAIGNRFYRLSYLVCAVAQCSRVEDETFEKLLRCLVIHSYALSDNDRFLFYTNHGILQALAQICGASRFLAIEKSDSIKALGMAAVVEQGEQRLLSVLKNLVTPEGILKEHSVSYHVISAHILDWVIANDIVSDAEIVQLVKRMRAAAAWMFDFNGRVANLGDTDLEPPFPFAGKLIQSPAGTKCVSQVFAEGGYWFVKGPENGGVYLAQTASFHSRVHKQADTGAFIWRDRGLDILIDAGRYGYVGRTTPGDQKFRNGFWYSDPRRIYVESTAAHNTIGVDGRDHPRYRSRPFGSGIIATTEKGGVFACETTILNLPQISHFRLLVLRPHQWLLCLDTIRARDTMSHAVAQNFHLHPDWILIHKDDRQAHFRHASDTMLQMTPIFDTAWIDDSARGHGFPEDDSLSALFGWWSPRHMVFEPCNSVRVAAEGDHITIATLFSFEDVNIDKAFSGFNPTRRRLRFRWSTPSGTETLTIDRSTAQIDQRQLKIS